MSSVNIRHTNGRITHPVSNVCMSCGRPSTRVRVWTYSKIWIVHFAVLISLTFLTVFVGGLIFFNLLRSKNEVKIPVHTCDKHRKQYPSSLLLFMMVVVAYTVIGVPLSVILIIIYRDLGWIRWSIAAGWVLGLILLRLIEALFWLNTPHVAKVSSDEMTLSGVDGTFAQETASIRDSYDYNLPLDWPPERIELKCRKCDNFFMKFDNESITFCKKCRTTNH